MGNHIHLLLKEGAESLEQVFKRVCGKFVYRYNAKYQRTGPLFQDRFKSEPVDTQAYLQTGKDLSHLYRETSEGGLTKLYEHE